MNIRRLVLLLASFAVATTSFCATPDPRDSSSVSVPEYKLQPGDRISIQVFQEPKLALTSVPVGAAGEIQIAGIATPIQVGDRTVREAVAAVQAAYDKSGLVATPRVTITIASYAPRSRTGR
jgi:protein involved in polysaccharide export with SLBB domain